MGATWELDGNMMGTAWEPSHRLHEALYFQNCLSPFLAWANGKGTQPVRHSQVRLLACLLCQRCFALALGINNNTGQREI
jgi:hypothetical protein